MGEPLREPTVTAHVSMIGLVSFSEVAPLLDAINEHSLHVSVSRWNMEQPAAQGLGPDTMLALSFIWDYIDEAAGAALALYIGSFLKKMAETVGEKAGEDTWGAVRAQMRRLTEHGKRKGRGGLERKYEPLVLNVGVRDEGTLHFVFEGRMTDEELRERLVSAGAYVEQLPDEQRHFRFRPSSRNWCYWDEETRSWRPSGEAPEGLDADGSRGT